MITNEDAERSIPTLAISGACGQESVEVRQARVVVVEGPSAGAVCAVSADGLLVGTGRDCGLVLDDPSVSRRHFELHPHERGFHLRDLESKNGTTVSGVAVLDAFLQGGEAIGVGRSKLRLDVGEDCDAYPLSAQHSFGALVGESVTMRRVFGLLERAAPTDATLLLEGESGTGKELAAQAVHRASNRRKGPYVVVDCGAIAPSLVESELFGHRRGAFTGAHESRKGAFELAQGGTVFLDEIGELDLALQPRLLRLLDSRRVKRVGDSSYRTIDVRIIAATHRNLEAEVRSGKFREDLFFRLSVLRVRLPPLRERGEDIALIARCLAQAARPGADPMRLISEETATLLSSYAWPGNVRELRNAVERLMLYPEDPRLALALFETGGDSSDDGVLHQADLAAAPFLEARQAWNDRFERAYVKAAMARSNNVVAHAADLAGISRQTFHRLLSKHQLPE